ncbi:MAG: hypothetical protein ACFFAN_05020 [Promethearchaeota archaeon]
MVIREAGLLFRGYSLVHAHYHRTSDDKIHPDIRSGLLTAFLNFAETAFSKGLVEYFEMNKFIIAFIGDNIKTIDGIEPELLISYAILDKEKKVDKYISKVIIPSLKKMSIQFKEKYNGKNLSLISQFKSFKQNLDTIFGSDTKTLNQKLKGTFFD